MDKYREQRRFWCRVVQGERGCWLWIGGMRDTGYGTFAVRAINGQWTQTTAHRFSYQNQVGQIPEGFEVDHLCVVRGCVRPDHLEAVTVQENRRRRDLKMRFNVPTDHKPLPIIPPKSEPPPKIDRTKFCPSGHEYSVTGKIKNGTNRNGNRVYTCAACRKVFNDAKRKGNAAATREHCPQGHPYSGDNLIRKIKMKNGRPYNSRQCRICTRIRNRLAAQNHSLVNLLS